jgi:hypothetical protein
MFCQIENFCHAALLSGYLLVLLNEGSVRSQVNAPRRSQDSNVLSLCLGMGLVHQKNEILSEPILKCPNGRVMDCVDIQTVGMSELPHFFPTSAVQTEPPGPEPSDASCTEGQ